MFRSVLARCRRRGAARCGVSQVATTALPIFFVGVLGLLLAGCSTAAVGPRVYYSITAAGVAAQPEVYVAAESTTRDDQPIAMTVLDPVTGQALDTFPLSASGALPCGAPLLPSNGHSISYVTVNDRYVPFNRWEDAVSGHAEPYRVRLYFRSNQGVIWEAEVMPSYSGCVTR